MRAKNSLSSVFETVLSETVASPSLIFMGLSLNGLFLKASFKSENVPSRRIRGNGSLRSLNGPLSRENGPIVRPRGWFGILVGCLKIIIRHARHGGKWPL